MQIIYVEPFFVICINFIGRIFLLVCRTNKLEVVGMEEVTEHVCNVIVLSSKVFYKQ